MARLAIIGAGDLGIQIAHCAKRNGKEVVGFFDDFACPGINIIGISVLGKISDIHYLSTQFDELLIGIGYKHMDFREHI